MPDRSAERRVPTVPADRPGPASFVVVPVMEEDVLLALLYVDSSSRTSARATTSSGSRSSRASSRRPSTDSGSPRPVGGSGDAWETYLERTPVEDMEREKLLLLLNRNEWNIARVARLMGVTRRTMYLRLQRYNIPRERVPKSRLKSVS